MTALLFLDQGTGRTFARFILSPGEDPGGEVSVVGSFNDWVAGVHALVRQHDGTSGVVAEVRHPGDVHFRYLADGGRWFDDLSAHHIDAFGSTLLRDRALHGSVEPAAPVDPRVGAGAEGKRNAKRTKTDKKKADKKRKKKSEKADKKT